MLSTWGVVPQVGVYTRTANPRLRLEFGESDSDSDDEYISNEEKDEEELSTDFSITAEREPDEI